MTHDEALNNIGQPFRWLSYRRFDIIRKVKSDGTIVGDFIEAHCLQCRLKGDQPEQLKDYQQSKKENDGE